MDVTTDGLFCMCSVTVKLDTARMILIVTEAAGFTDVSRASVCIEEIMSLLLTVQVIGDIFMLLVTTSS